MDLDIRPESIEDGKSVWDVNLAAFGTDAESKLIEALRDGGYVEVSLIAAFEGKVVGHILFSRMTIGTALGTVDALSLAPMAVLPEYQRRGIGSKLVEAGLEACRQRGHKIVLVLGHPQFYPRFGFSVEQAKALASPFGAGDAWMARELQPGALADVAGEVEYSPPFYQL